MINGNNKLAIFYWCLLLGSSELGHLYIYLNSLLQLFKRVIITITIEKNGTQRLTFPRPSTKIWVEVSLASITIPLCPLLLWLWLVWPGDGCHGPANLWLNSLGRNSGPSWVISPWGVSPSPNFAFFGRRIHRRPLLITALSGVDYRQQCTLVERLRKIRLRFYRDEKNNICAFSSFLGVLLNSSYPMDLSSLRLFQSPPV